MSSTRNRLALAAFATAGVYLAIPVLDPSPVMAAPSPGVPCVSLFQTLVTNPPQLPESPEAAAHTFTDMLLPTPPAAVPPASGGGGAAVPPGPPTPGAPVTNQSRTAVPPGPPSPPAAGGGGGGTALPPGPDRKSVV